MAVPQEKLNAYVKYITDDQECFSELIRRMTVKLFDDFCSPPTDLDPDQKRQFQDDISKMVDLTKRFCREISKIQSSIPPSSDLNS
jgi:hypothetical protein